MSDHTINNSSMLSVGSKLRGIYRIDSYLSSGGFGNTYLATNVEFEEVVAIKEFYIRGVTQRDSNKTTVSVSNTENMNLFTEQLQKFKKEARRLRKMKNEHIVKVHDLFEENGTAYYVMDYIDGENLADKLKRLQKPLNESDVMDYLSQILDALESVHQENIWHLDLKPANIMVDKEGHITLIDFGASKQHNNSDKAITSTAVSYTNGFAPREQMEQNISKFGPWTDLYALGATLYNLLVNRKPPMPSDIDDDHSADKHLALPMSTGISENTRMLILRLMTTNRFERPQSVAKVKEMIEKAPTKTSKRLEENKENEKTAIFENIEQINNQKIIKPDVQKQSDIVVENNLRINDKLLIFLVILIFFSILICSLYTGFKPTHDNKIDSVSQADVAEQVVEKTPNLADVLAKAKAEGAKWSVDEWKASFKDLMLAIRPMMIDMKNMYDEIKKDPSKAAEAITKAAEVEKKYPKYSEMMDEFIEVASASENGRTVVDDEEWGKSLMKELGVPDFDEE